ncbi:hypothetical protein KEM55_004134 [Ascosphaera atra]|nr:hypothetical protein KEM55_004134 [Ascosphaera atra]
MAPKKASISTSATSYTSQLCTTCTEQYKRNPEIEPCKRIRGPKKNCDKCKDDKKRCKSIPFPLLHLKSDLIEVKCDHDKADRREKGRLAAKVTKLAEELLAAFDAEKQGGATKATTARASSALAAGATEGGDNVFADNGGAAPAPAPPAAPAAPVLSGPAPPLATRQAINVDDDDFATSPKSPSKPQNKQRRHVQVATPTTRRFSSRTESPRKGSAPSLSLPPPPQPQRQDGPLEVQMVAPAPASAEMTTILRMVDYMGLVMRTIRDSVTMEQNSSKSEEHLAELVKLQQQQTAAINELLAGRGKLAVSANADAKEDDDNNADEGANKDLVTKSMLK